MKTPGRQVHLMLQVLYWVVAFEFLSSADFVHAAATESSMFCEAMVTLSGYNCTEYEIKTDDGFLLLLHHIKGRDHSNSGTGLFNDSRPTGSENAQYSRIKPEEDKSQRLKGSPRSSSDRKSIAVDRPAKGLNDAIPKEPAESSLGRDEYGLTSPEKAGFADHAKGRGLSVANEKTPHAALLSRGERNPAEASTPRRPGASNTSTGDGEQVGAPVLLMHPEFLNGDSWFIPVEPDGVILPFLLADEGFDVWIGHQRATFWCHGHVNLKPRDPAFWNWTWDQHAQYDIPAMLKFIKSKSGAKVHYVGVSQSASTGVAAATVPRMSQFFQSLTLIGPPIYRATNSLLLRAWAGFFGSLLDGSARDAGHGAFNSSQLLKRRVLPIRSPFTWPWITLASGLDCCLSEETILVGNEWDGTTSLKNLLHIQQAILTNSFQRFDYGTVSQNMEVYGGQERPPCYTPKTISAKIQVLIAFGGHDTYAPPSGVLEFANLLKKPPVLIHLPLYAHFDMFFSTRRLEDVYTPIIHFLRTHSEKNHPSSQTSATSTPQDTSPDFSHLPYVALANETQPH